MSTSCKATSIQAASTPDAPMIFVRDCFATIEVKCRIPQNGNRGESKLILHFPIETKRRFENYLKSASGRAFLKKRL
jgi:hypothetical protein